MKREHQGPPRTIEDLVEEFDQRKIYRRLHELGDEGIAFLLEVAAIKQDSPEAEFAARDLRKHIMNGGIARNFLDEFPEHQEVDFGELDIDTSLVEIATSSTLLLPTSKAALEVERKRSVAGAIEKSKLVLSSEVHEKTGTLFATYPSIEVFFSDENEWVEDGEDKFIKRKKIEELLTKKDPEKEMSDTHKSWLMNQLWKKWKQQSPDQTGRRLKNEGLSIFLSSEEAINFLWFIHTQTENESRFQNYSIAKRFKKK